MKPLYNSKIIDTYIKLVKNRYSFVNINELLNYAGMHSYEIADQGHWFTQDQVDRFYYKLVQMTNNENIAREAGRYAASPDALGTMRQFVLGFIGPANTFEIINRITSSFSKSASYQPRMLSPNKVEIVVTTYAGVEEKQFQCENRLGLFEAIVMQFNNELPHVEHPECLFKGDKSCRYIITWRKPGSTVLKKIFTGITAVFVIISFVLAGSDRWNYLEHLLPLFIFVFSVFVFVMAKTEKKELLSRLSNTNDFSENLIDQINSNYNSALMTNEIGCALGSNTNRDDIIANVIRIMENRLEYDRGIILIANPERNKLVLKAGYGYSDELRRKLESSSFNVDRLDSRGIFSVSFREQKPFLVNNVLDIEENLSTQSLEFAKVVGSKSFICCPIVCEGQSTGVIAVDNVNTKRPLVQSDISRLIGVASVIGISLRNADLIESKVRQFNSVLQVLAASIDARDSLTAGHSEMVTKYSLGICKELNLSSEESEAIRVASLLHDYGKIGVPDAILKKEGLLSTNEYTIVKTHAPKTREILSRINFEGIYSSVPAIAGAHHEKVDGSGYPDGLVGNDIPLGARIIAVADYFEAITAKRHYREPMLLEDAFQSLYEEAGRGFDKRIIDAFLNYYSKENNYQPFNAGELNLFTSRQRTRYAARLPVTVKSDGLHITTNSLDLSMRGAYVACAEPVAEGQVVELSFKLPGSSEIIETRGQVAWVNTDQSKKTSVSAGFGVEFMEYVNMAERALEAFLISFETDSFCQENARV